MKISFPQEREVDVNFFARRPPASVFEFPRTVSAASDNSDGTGGEISSSPASVGKY